MMVRNITLKTQISALFLCLSITAGMAQCSDFDGSTMNATSIGPKAVWRTDYPDRPEEKDVSWLNVDFKKDPKKYMRQILQSARTGFSIKEKRLVGSGDEQWWASPWMDFTDAGRERNMGLTKERGPHKGDLAKNSPDTSQVWAVGFYNEPGAAIFGDIYEDPCNPFLPVALQFPKETVSIKFLFTDADPKIVTYLASAPEFEAWIDTEKNNAKSKRPPKERMLKTVRLLQFDIAAKDERAETDWVFATFAWMGPRKGDGFFDNLVPVSLQWGNDPKVYNQEIVESWINPSLKGIIYGWDARSTLGFNGRANGPADNIKSSCLSCHASARTPGATKRLLDRDFDMENDLANPSRVKSHVDVWFQNQPSKGLFMPHEPAVSTLDYSLQLENSIYRMCQACATGDLKGETPSICRRTGFYNKKICNVKDREAEKAGTLSAVGVLRQEALRAAPPARQ